MNIHEYQAKQLLEMYGIPVPRGFLIQSLESFDADWQPIVENLKDAKTWVVKAQIHAGGRGKAGGVKICKTLAECKQQAKLMLGKNIVTHQTGPAGKIINKVLICEAADIQKEFYLGIVLDRSYSEIVMMASQEGGVEIEEVAQHHPEKITYVRIDPTTGFMPFHGRKIAYALGLEHLLKESVEFFQKVYTCYVLSDCALLEVNPLVLTKNNQLLALDAKMSFDANALMRQPEILKMRDITEENPQDVEASKYDLAYIALSGNIGCLVNGAGLAMATMDIIKLYGGEPANFLDVGGGASQEKVSHAFKIILKDPQVKAILVNIFGGIMKCDVIAEGIIAAAKEVALSVPLVVRLEGTNVEQGKKILAQSGLKIIAANSLADAAQLVVQASQ